MAFDPRNITTYSTEMHSSQPMSHYQYSDNHMIHPDHKMDENRNENHCDNKDICTPVPQQPPRQVQKVDAATMTDPLQIDFNLTSEYLARYSNPFGLPYVSKYDDSNSNSSAYNSQDFRPKTEYDLEPQKISGVLVYSCPECAFRFEDKDSLQEHIEEHKQRPFVCDVCGTSLKRKEHLDRHKQGHNTDRPFQCQLCCKAFKRNEHLARHMVTHSGSKNQVCTECGKAFYRKDHLKKHLLSHSLGKGRKTNSSQDNNQQQEEGLSTFALMMRQVGPPPFSIIRT